MKLSFKIVVFSVLCLISVACNSSREQTVAKNFEENVPVSQTPVELTATTESTGGKVNPKELNRRSEVHELMLKGEYLHDGSIELLSIGDISSVPALLATLKKHPPSPHGGLSCTTAHAIEALEKITGAKPGLTHNAWSSWWDRYQAKQKNKTKSAASNSSF